MGPEQQQRRTSFPGFLKGALIIATVLVIGLAAIGGPVLAGKGGTQGANQGGGNGKGRATPTPTGTCLVTPNPAPLGSTIVISGSGVPANQSVGIVVTGPEGQGPQMGFAMVDGSGNYSRDWTATWAGTSSVSVQSGSTVLQRCTFQAS